MNHSHLQALLFHHPPYTVPRARMWSRNHGYRPLKYHVTKNYIRARLEQPNSKKYNYRTINLLKDVKAVTQYKPKRKRNIHRGGFISPEMIDRGLNLLANLILPAAIYGGVSYGIYRAVKK